MENTDRKNSAKKKKEEATVETVDLGGFNKGFFANAFNPEQLVPNETSFGSVGVYSEYGVIPKYATAGSACFDIQAYFGDNERVSALDRANRENPLKVRTNEAGEKFILLEHGDRALVPTGLFFDLPDFTVLEVYSRSGLSWKSGLILTNGVGIVDSDYVEEVFVSLTNISGAAVRIKSGDRIAQGRIVDAGQTPLVSAPKPSPKTNRNGGFGSTGV